jgi:hypothetical protein
MGLWYNGHCDSLIRWAVYCKALSTTTTIKKVTQRRPQVAMAMARILSRCDFGVAHRHTQGHCHEHYRLPVDVLYTSLQRQNWGTLRSGPSIRGTCPGATPRVSHFRAFRGPCVGGHVWRRCKDSGVAHRNHRTTIQVCGNLQLEDLLR